MLPTTCTSCFLLPASYVPRPASCVLRPTSCFLRPTSYFLLPTRFQADAERKQKGLTVDSPAARPKRETELQYCKRISKDTASYFLRPTSYVLRLTSYPLLPGTASASPRTQRTRQRLTQCMHPPIRMHAMCSSVRSVHCLQVREGQAQAFAQALSRLTTSTT